MHPWLVMIFPLTFESFWNTSLLNKKSICKTKTFIVLNFAFKVNKNHRDGDSKMASFKNIRIDCI